MTARADDDRDGADDRGDAPGSLEALDDRHAYRALAAAYCRGKLDRPDDDDDTVLHAGLAAGLRLHRFKRTTGLPRVRRVLGALRALAPQRLLDVGSGRGVFLWPLLDALPDVAVTAVDVLAHRVADIQAVRRGGVDRLTTARMDAGALAFADAAVDVVTVLEVLEHLPDPAPAAREAVRVAARAVVVSVPSKEDDNPEHLRVFDAPTMTALLRDAGARRVSVEFVLNHMVAVALR